VHYNNVAIHAPDAGGHQRHGVILTRNPTRQAIGASLYGLLLATLFVALQGPVVSVIVVPLMTLLALAKVRDYQLDQQKRSPEQ
jgi:hypothetical protein